MRPQMLLGLLPTLPFVVLGADDALLHISGDTARINFNAHSPNNTDMEMVAQRGQLNLSGVMVAQDYLVRTCSGDTFRPLPPPARATAVTVPCP